MGCFELSGKFPRTFEPNFVGIFELKAKVSQNIQLVCFPALILNFRGCAVYLRPVSDDGKE
jgi:hypothetical protein